MVAGPSPEPSVRQITVNWGKITLLRSFLIFFFLFEKDVILIVKVVSGIINTNKRVIIFEIGSSETVSQSGDNFFR